MIVMPVIVRSDLRWSPYHIYLGKNIWLLTSLYYLPKKMIIDVKSYLSKGDIKEEKGHFPLDGVENSNIFIDNGVFTLTLQGKKIPSPKELADTYLNRVTGADLIAAGPDFPINLNEFSIDEKINRAQKTVENMEEFLSYYNGEAKPVAVIQAMGTQMALDQAKDYKAMGYDTVAIGTMGNAVTEELLQQSQAVSDLGIDVHIFGATPPSVLPLLNYYEVDMADSHSPLRWSMYGQILDPKDYRLKNTKDIKHDEWTCDCPVCRENRERVLNPTTTRIADIRAVHNLLILQKAAHDPNLRRSIIEAQRHFNKTSACKRCKYASNIGACTMKKFRGECLIVENDFIIATL